MQNFNQVHSSLPEFFRVAPIGALFESNEQNRIYIFKFYKLLPPPGYEPGSFDAIIRCLIHYAMTTDKFAPEFIVA